MKNQAPSTDLQYFTFLEARDAGETALVPTRLNDRDYVGASFSNGLDWTVLANKTSVDGLIARGGVHGDGKLVAWVGADTAATEFFAARMESLQIGAYGFKTNERTTIYFDQPDGIAVCESTTVMKVAAEEIWAIVVDGVPRSVVDPPAEAAFCTLAVGTHTFRLIEDSESATGVAEGSGGESVPGLAALPARPNPFAGRTAISYTIPADHPLPATLGVYNVGGRRVREWTLRDRWGVVEWDGKNDGGESVSSGVYFYVLRSGSDRVRGRLVYLR